MKSQMVDLQETQNKNNQTDNEKNPQYLIL